MTNFQQAKNAFIEYCKLSGAGAGGSERSLELIQIWKKFVERHNLNATILAVVFESTHYAKYITTEEDYSNLWDTIELFKNEASQLSKDLIQGKILANDFKNVFNKNSFTE